MRRFVIINKKTKKFGKFDLLQTKFIDVDSVFDAKIWFCEKDDDTLMYIAGLLRHFRIISKYEIHELFISLKKNQCNGRKF